MQQCLVGAFSSLSYLFPEAWLPECLYFLRVAVDARIDASQTRDLARTEVRFGPGCAVSIGMDWSAV